MDLIFVSMEDWDAIWRRNQFVCAELARRHPEMKILFVGLARDVSNQLRRALVGRSDAGTRPATSSVESGRGDAGKEDGATGRRGDGATTQSSVLSPQSSSLLSTQHPALSTVSGFGNIFVTKPLKLLPNSLALGRKINEAMMRRHVKDAAATLGLRDPVLWLNPHYAVHMAGRMGESAVIYDITDDWTSLSQKSSVAERWRRQDAALCHKSDAVIVCSQRLYEMKRGMARSLHLIPNGVDVGHYRGILEGEGPLPVEAANWPKPVLGYTGTVHPDRVDVDLVEQVARGLAAGPNGNGQPRHGGSVVLVGPSHLPEATRQRLEACGNVFLVGPVPYENVPNTMRAFDVCITPHRVTPFTESLNPIKLWEYLAAGKPIVSTDVAGFRDYPQFVRLAQGPEAFLTAVREALAEGREVGEARRREAAKHSWSSRVDAIEAIIDECLNRRREPRGSAAGPAGSFP